MEKKKNGFHNRLRFECVSSNSIFHIQWYPYIRSVLTYRRKTKNRYSRCFVCDGQVSVDGENRLRFNKHKHWIKIKSFETVSVWLIRPHLLMRSTAFWKRWIFYYYYASQVSYSTYCFTNNKIYLVPLQSTHSHIPRIVCRLFGQPFDTFFLLSILRCGVWLLAVVSQDCDVSVEIATHEWWIFA